MSYIIHPNYDIFPSMWDINKVVIKPAVDEQPWLFAWHCLLLQMFPIWRLLMN